MKQDGRQSERERHQHQEHTQPDAALHDIDPERADRAFGRLLALWCIGSDSGAGTPNGSSDSNGSHPSGPPAALQPDPQLVEELIQSGLVEPIIQPAPHDQPPSDAPAVGLTASGAALYRQVLRFAEGVLTAPALAESPVKPRWDAKKRELSVGGVLVRRFRRTAANQHVVLATFEEQSWPRRIDDPLPHDPFMLESMRMHDTIKWLNRGLYVPWFRFHAAGSAHGICWRVIIRPGAASAGQTSSPSDPDHVSHIPR